MAEGKVISYNPRECLRRKVADLGISLTGDWLPAFPWWQVTVCLLSDGRKI